jgi:hypothetical protein
MEKFKVIVAGGRLFNNYSLLKEKLDNLLSNKINIEIVSGMAKGADKLGERYAKEKNLGLKYFPAQWDKIGNTAGYVRNIEMAEYADACVCFWDGKSFGTRHMIETAKKHNLKLRIIHY